MHSPVISTIVHGLAEADRMSSEDLEYVLNDYIDPDILLSLTEQDRTDWTFSFTVEDHVVEISSTGIVTIDDIQIPPRTHSTSI